MEEVCSLLPAEIQTMKDSLDRDTTDLRRREAGAEDFQSSHGCIPHAYIAVPSLTARAWRARTC